MERSLKYSVTCLAIFALGTVTLLCYLVYDNTILLDDWSSQHFTVTKEELSNSKQVVTSELTNQYDHNRQQSPTSQRDGKLDVPTVTNITETMPQRDLKATTKVPLKASSKATKEASTSNSKAPTTSKSTTTKPSGEPVSQGYAFIYSNFEEQTNGARNLWQLEMWAKLFDIKVAEPFAVDSMFGLKGALPNTSQSLRFSDYYDIKMWNKMVSEYGGSPLVKWENFLSNAPHKAVILCTVMRAVKQTLIVSFGEEDVKKLVPQNDMVWLKKKFDIVRMVTFVRSISSRHAVTLEEYNSYLFGDLEPNQVTLIVVNWFGIGVQIERVEIKSNPSTKSFLSSTRIAFVPPVNSSHVSPNVLPSQRVLNAYKTYVAEYIGDRKYVGIIFRTHCVLFYFAGSFDVKKKHLLSCSKQLSDVLNKIRNKWEIFMAYDLDSFGSDGYYKSSDKRLIPVRNQIFLDVFNGSLQMKQREERLIKAAGGVTDKGFIALLEKTIATHADCIVLLGVASSFVDSSAQTYISLHNSSTMCVVSVCARNYGDSAGKKVSSQSIPDKFV